MKRFFLYITGLFLLNTFTLAQSTNITINERQIFVPLLEIEDFSELTPNLMDEAIQNHSHAQKIQKKEMEGSSYYTLNLRDENYTFMGFKLCECETYFSKSYNPRNKITSTNVTLEFTAPSDDVALAKLKVFANALNKSKIVKTKIRLENCPKDKLLHGEVYKTPFFIYSADTYAARDCYITLSTDNPELNGTRMGIGIVEKAYKIKFGMYSIFYRDGQNWINLEWPFWKESGKYLK